MTTRLPRDHEDRDPVRIAMWREGSAHDIRLRPGDSSTSGANDALYKGWYLALYWFLVGLVAFSGLGYVAAWFLLSRDKTTASRSEMPLSRGAV